MVYLLVWSHVPGAGDVLLSAIMLRGRSAQRDRGLAVAATPTACSPAGVARALDLARGTALVAARAELSRLPAPVHAPECLGLSCWGRPLAG
jgi:hypothetical protein